MSDTVVYAFDYNMMTICWLRECGILPHDCDLMLLAGPGFVERLKTLDKFANIFLVMNPNAHGQLYSHRESAICRLLEDADRPRRNTMRYLELAEPGRFFLDKETNYRRMFVPTTSLITPGTYTNTFHNRQLRVFLWEHAITIAQIATRVSFSYHFNHAVCLPLGVQGIEQPSRYLRGIYVARPEAIPETAEYGMPVHRVPLMDRANAVFKEEMNFLFAYSKEQQAVYARHDCIVFPYLGDPDDARRRRRIRLLDTFADILGRDNMLIKPHPRSNAMELAEVSSFPVFLEHGIPFEVSAFNIPDMGKRLIIASYTTIAALTPKMFFDDEPYVMILDNVFSLQNDASNLAELFAIKERIKELYREPEKFFIPQTEDEAVEFVQRFANTRKVNHVS